LGGGVVVPGDPPGIATPTWRGRYVSLSVFPVSATVTQAGDGVTVCVGDTLALDFNIKVGSSTVQIPLEVLDLPFPTGSTSSLRDTYPEGFVDAEAPDNVTITVYLIPKSLIDIQSVDGNNLNGPLISQTTPLLLTTPPPVVNQFTRVSPPQVPCPLYEGSVSLTLPAFTALGDYLLVIIPSGIKFEREEAFGPNVLATLEAQFDVRNFTLDYWDIDADMIGPRSPLANTAFFLPVRVTLAGNCSVPEVSTDGWLWEDKDADTLPDLWEKFNFGNLDFIANDDPGPDGSSNSYEMFHETSPKKLDRHRVVVNSPFGSIFYNKAWSDKEWFFEQALKWRIDNQAIILPQLSDANPIYISKVTEVVSGNVVYPDPPNATVVFDSAWLTQQFIFDIANVDRTLSYEVEWTLVGDDGDLLDFQTELLLGQDPLVFHDYNSDTDGDNLTDFQELIIYGTNHLLADTDGDGINDFDEINIHGTSPLSPDSDGDWLPDGWELDNGLLPTVSNEGDTDSDGLSDHQEYELGTDPLVADTDSDDLEDGDEVNVHNTNPLIADTDNDGLGDGDELNDSGPFDNDGFITDPLNIDTDGDGMPDGWEVSHGLDPTSAAGDDGATGNPDGDSADNLAEYNRGTDPQVPDDPPAPTGVGLEVHTPLEG